MKLKITHQRLEKQGQIDKQYQVADGRIKYREFNPTDQ
jgi:hypothetical protein